MVIKLFEKLKKKVINWLMLEHGNDKHLLCDFDRITYEIRPCDILLIEGTSRISEVIRQVTLSPWTHACLYIGKLHDIQNNGLRKMILEHASFRPQEQLVIESLLGKGTIVRPLSKYEKAHIRICRPAGITREDAISVINYAIEQIGDEYGIEHLYNLARFYFPWSILPRRWRLNIFQSKLGIPTKDICSSMIAKAFKSVKYPILPIIKTDKDKNVKIYQKNPHLFTPSDFDYSPFFKIIKYPIIKISEHSTYRHLPWTVNKESD